jgi:hypothetical protein
MAQVDRSTHNDIDHLLERAFGAWESLADVEREIDTWDLEDQLAFVEEWPLEEMRLQRLAEHDRAGIFDDAQQAEYTRLLALVERNRPVTILFIGA